MDITTYWAALAAKNLLSYLKCRRLTALRYINISVTFCDFCFGFGIIQSYVEPNTLSYILIHPD